MNFFVEKPFLPQGITSLVLLDSRVDPSVRENLERHSMECILVDPCPSLYDAISCHPDIQCHPLGGNRIMVAPNVSESLKNQLIQQNFEIVLGNTRLEGNYPKNIAYNVARLGDIAFHNTAYTDPLLKAELEKQGIRFVHVKQGYTKCSVAIVSERALITSDKGIAVAARSNGLDALLVSPGFIMLEGLNYGFIGGTCGLIEKNTLAVIGKMAQHPDYARVKDFTNQYKVQMISLGDMGLSDFGSIIPLKENR